MLWGLFLLLSMLSGAPDNTESPGAHTKAAVSEVSWEIRSPMKQISCQPEHVGERILSAGAMAVCAIHGILVLRCSLFLMLCFPGRAMETAHNPGLLTPGCVNQAL